MIIRGISLGMYSCVFPVLIVGVSVLVSFYAAGGSANFNMGPLRHRPVRGGHASTLGITSLPQTPTAPSPTTRAVSRRWPTWART